jgi:AcrR family transcriptional regulator
VLYNGRMPTRNTTKGARTREEILRAAADIASVDGLDGLSIGRLAAELGMSKSGLFAHFGSKESLQLATIEEARHRYVKEVI